jgi:hypothetical protein
VRIAAAQTSGASGPHLLLIGLLMAGPCCALLTARWVPTATASCLALGLAALVSIRDQIFATITQYTFLAALAVVSLTANGIGERPHWPRAVPARLSRAERPAEAGRIASGGPSRGRAW